MSAPIIKRHSPTVSSFVDAELQRALKANLAVAQARCAKPPLPKPLASVRSSKSLTPPPKAISVAQTPFTPGQDSPDEWSGTPTYDRPKTGVKAEAIAHALRHQESIPIGSG